MNKICRNFIYLLRNTSLGKSYTSAAILGRNLSFKSDLSLGKIYPKSRLQLYTPQAPVNQGDKFSGFIPINKLQITYSRSSGPGGQHVNTVNTKVDVRFKLSEADWIPEKTRKKLLDSPVNQGDKFSGFIPINKLQITYSRSSGPGGQHVNTVNTKVDVRFKLSEADWIPEKTRKKLLDSNKITKDGYYVIKSDLTRSQQMNLADALEKLRCLIREYEHEAPVAAEETLEKMRRRQEKAARERLLLKRQRAQTKADRQGPSGVDL